MTLQPLIPNLGDMPSIPESSERDILRLLARCDVDRKAALPILKAEERGEQRHIAVPTPLTCLGPKVAGLLVRDPYLNRFEAISVVMDQSVTHLASKNKRVCAFEDMGNAVLRHMLNRLAPKDDRDCHCLQQYEVFGCGFEGFHVIIDPFEESMKADIIFALDSNVLLRYKVVAPGETDSILFRQRHYKVRPGEFWDQYPGVEVTFCDGESPLHALAWSMLPHVAIAAHRRESEPKPYRSKP